MPKWPPATYRGEGIDREKECSRCKAFKRMHDDKKRGLVAGFYERPGGPCKACVTAEQRARTAAAREANPTPGRKLKKDIAAEAAAPFTLGASWKSPAPKSST